MNTSSAGAETRPKAKDDRRSCTFRFPESALALVDQAAAVRHMDRTAFILDAMTRAAKETLLDQAMFPVDDEEYNFLADSARRPHEPTPAMKALARRKPLWDR